ncbi:MAG: Signal transduction histidine kinase [Devosia sp.]|nr:Signal transduction histidine kinase [Devosia sp.]
MHLLAQAHWSEMPIVVLLDRSVEHARIRSQLEKAWPGARQIYYQRPVAGLELVSGIESALAIRRRQKQVRDHIGKEIEFRLELNHRVKNILASVSSIFQMTRRGAHTVDELAEDFEGRLNALANVHSAVFQAGGEAVSLTTVIDLTVLPYRTEGESRFSVHGPDITITGEAGTTLALCLHELATNAIKYGAMSQSAGKVLLTWDVTTEAEPVLTMEWQESGGPPVSAPTRAGYGTRYIRSALATLFGEPPVMSYAAEGFRCTVSGPLRRVSPETQPAQPIP